MIPRETFETRALRSLRGRHESQISENAERIRDHIGYVLKRVESGRADATGMYAEDIAASVKRILRSVAALEAIKEAAGIYDSVPPEADAPAAWHADWDIDGRDHEGNAILLHKPTGGSYRLMPVED